MSSVFNFCTGTTIFGPSRTVNGRPPTGEIEQFSHLQDARDNLRGGLPCFFLILLSLSMGSIDPVNLAFPQKAKQQTTNKRQLINIKNAKDTNQKNKVPQRLVHSRIDHARIRTKDERSRNGESSRKEKT
ncbi:hypothetical protein D3C80_1818830 [compost metagenome]